MRGFHLYDFGTYAVASNLSDLRRYKETVRSFLAPLCLQVRLHRRCSVEDRSSSYRTAFGSKDNLVQVELHLLRFRPIQVLKNKLINRIHL